MKKITIYSIFVFSTFFACNKDTESTPLTSDKTKFTVGKNRFTIKIDGDDREYYVHIPKSYNATTAFPVAFMLHGTSGDGEKFYNISGWKELGETENIITVYPSSWSYCIVQLSDGSRGVTTKWNVVPDAEWTFCQGQTPRDDIKFLNAVITDLDSKYIIDQRRIYLSGFSNGGQMAAKCAIEMSDKFAAIAENAGSFYKDTNYIPKRKLPVICQIGNSDFGPGNTGTPVSLSKLESILSPGGKGIIYNTWAGFHVKYFSLSPSYTMGGDTTSVRTAIYKPLSGSDYEFRFILVSGLEHQYPNGVNHPLNAAKLHWAWMKQYTKP